ncbi:YDG domain-containing protein [Roseateles sp.]|uniref:YDG domain-containing protein n=1 Tax=Roseateles sp. TaxID=1971397 RepID=UPI003BA47C34
MNLSTAGNAGSAADIKVNGAIDTHLTGGNVLAMAQSNVVQAADVLAGAGDVTLTASSGSISRTAGTVGGNDVWLSAATTIGSSSQFINTSADTLKLTSAGSQFISEANDVILAASTSANGAVVANAGGALTVSTASSLTGISTGSGEINLKGASLALDANASTTGIAFLEATGAMTDIGSGLLSANQAVLTAGGNIGSSSQRLLTQVSSLALQAAGNSTTSAYVNEADALTLSAKAPNGAALDVQNTTGSLTLGSFSVVPAVSNAAGYTAPSNSAVGVDASGAVTLKALSGSIDVAKSLLAAGTVNLVGNTADGNTAVQLRSGRSITNNAAAGESTTLQATQGNISADGLMTVVGGAGAGVIQLLAGSIASAAGAIDGSFIQITQGGVGTAQGNNGTVGVRVQSSGIGDVIAPKIINNGSGNVVLSAGSALAAGNASGGQLKTASGNSTSHLAGGKTYVYTGAAASSGDLEIIDSGFSMLYLSTMGINLANAKTFTDYASGPQQNSGGNTQVMAREQLSFTDKINTTSLRITYGDADPTLTQVKDAMKAANLSGGSSIVETVAAGSNAYQVTRAALIDDLTLTQPATNGSPRHVGTVANGFAAGYAYGLSGNNFVQVDSTPVSATASLFVDPKQVTLSATKTYDGNADMTGYVTLSGLVGGQTLNYSGATANGKNVSATSSAQYISAITLQDGTGLAADYTTPSLTGAVTASGTTGGNQASVTARTVSLSGSKTYDGSTALGEGQLTVAGLVAGESLRYSGATVQSKNAFDATAAAGYVNAVTLLDAVGATALSGGLASNYVVPNLTQHVSGVNEAVVNPAALTAVITGEARKVYDGNLNASLNAANFQVSGLASGETAVISFADLTLPVAGQYASKNVRDNSLSAPGLVSAAISPSQVQISAGDARNYSLPSTAQGAVGVITPKSSTVTATATTMAYNSQTQQQAAAQTSGFISSDQITVAGLASGRNAGLYGSTLSLGGTDASNYSPSFNNADLVITRASATVSGVAGSAVYNGSTQTQAAPQSQGFWAGDVITIAGQASGRNAGVYSSALSVGGADAGNYNVTITNADFYIGRASASVTGTATTRSYNGAVQQQTTAVLSGFLPSDNIQVQGLASGRDAGLYASSLNISGADAGNYNVTTTNADLLISKAVASVNATPTSRSYNGLTQTQGAAISSGFLPGDDIQIQGLASGRNAGVYTSSLSVAGADARNYTITFNNADLSIARANASVSAAATSKVYNGSVQVQDAAQSQGFLPGDDIRISGEASGLHAGSYVSNLTVGGADRSNYNISINNNPLLIAKKALTLTGLQAADKVYDGNAAASILGGVLDGIVGGETLGLSGRGVFANKNAGSNWTVTVNDVSQLTRVNGSGSWDDYTLNASGPLQTQASILKRDLLLQAGNVSTGYGDVRPLTFSASGLVSGETLDDAAVTGASLRSPGYLPNLRTADAGVYDITGQGGSAQNYSVLWSTTPGVLTINKAKLTYLPTAHMKLLTEADPTLSGLFTGFKNGDNSSIANDPSLVTRPGLKRVVGEIAGQYLISEAAPGLARNYEIETVPGRVFTIVPAQTALVPMKDVSTVYGALGDVAPAIDTDNVRYLTADGHTIIRMVLTGTETLASAPRALVSANLSPAGLRYTFADGLGGVLQVTPMLSQVSVQSGRGGYAGAVSNSNSGTSLSLGNFLGVTTQEMTYLVDAAPLYLQTNSYSKVYDGLVSAIAPGQVIAVGLKNGDSLASIGGASVTGEAVNARNAGRYAFTAALANPELAGNYFVAPGSGELTITPAPLTLTAGTDVKTYDGNTNSTGEVAIRGLLNSDTARASQSFQSSHVLGSHGSTLLVSTYQVQDGNGGANYAVSTQSTPGTILPKAVLPVFSAADKTYDGNALTTMQAIELQGVLPGETLQLQGNGQFASPNAGRKLTVSIEPAQLRYIDGSGRWSDYQLAGTAPYTAQASIAPKQLNIVGSTVADKVYDGSLRADLRAGSLIGLVGNETLGLGSSQAAFQSPEVGFGKPVDVSYLLSNGLNGGLAANYLLAAEVLSGNVLAGDSRRPDPPKPLPRPPWERDKSIRWSAQLGLQPKTPDLCTAEDLGVDSVADEDRRTIECLCERTLDPAVKVCYVSNR